MIPVEKRIDIIVRFGEEIGSRMEAYKSDPDSELGKVISKSKIENPWFTEKSILTALQNWVSALSSENVLKWTNPYLPGLSNKHDETNVAVVNAGNLPFVGLHDLLSVLHCGFNYTGKNATGDSYLLPYLTSILCIVEPTYKDKIRFVSRLGNMDAVIATGNNNSSRYFEFYFGKYPHIIRKNRNGAGVLTGKETKEQLKALGEDIFTHFGLGCRNVSKLYIPEQYDFREFFEAMDDFKEITLHSKYMNNFDYNNSVFLLKQIPFLQNGFLIVRKEKQIASPVSVLHYEEYNNVLDLRINLTNNINHFQCVVAEKEVFKDNKELERIRVDFGKTQSPSLWDYADGVDTINFLINMKS